MFSGHLPQSAGHGVRKSVSRTAGAGVSLSADPGEAGMDQAEATRLEQQINREVIARFPAGAIERVALVRDHEDPLLEPGELLIRVFAAAPDRALDTCAQDHQVGMRRRGRESPLRLPRARLLEFRVARSAAAPLPRADAPAVADEPVPVAESVTM